LIRERRKKRKIFAKKGKRFKKINENSNLLSSKNKLQKQ